MHYIRKNFAALTAIAAAMVAVALLSVYPPTDAQAQAFPNVYSAAYTTAFDLSDAAGATVVVNAPSAALGDFCLASVSVDIVDATLTCYIQAAGKAEVRFQNESGTSTDLAGGTVRVIVFPKGTR
jgi:hypothetical protein